MKVLIKGAGEQASGVAHRLFRCGFRVAMTDLARPTAIRRTVSFASAIEDGAIEIEGVRGARHRLEDLAAPEAGGWDHVPVIVDPESRVVALWRPDVIVDARILKTNLDNRLEDAALVIGLGPGLEAGRHVHVAIETRRGHDLGRIVERGFTSPDTGEPGEIGGYARERLLRAPVSGTFESRRAIGERIAAGEEFGSVAGASIRAAIAGLVRGLLRPGLEVHAGQKIGDIDPRGDPALCRTISDKARTISGSVLEVVVAHAARTARHR
ncbi:MAG TPA: selenium-dependent molybdenum cofactor biosynthesis protein YqeB [Terriglobales bacterium]|nr:selenium-dependent molybdenum cofactor biosynthesis protein YqeB [Terriglobales bacterium]